MCNPSDNDQSSSNNIDNKRIKLDNEDELNLNNLYDVHCHIQEQEPLPNNLDFLLVKKVAIMGTNLSDWEKVESLFKNNSEKVIPCFGIHPWFSERVVKQCEKEGKDWIKLLKSYLEKYDNAIVGEIGVDRSAVDLITKNPYPMEIQLELFNNQLQLAYQYQRPVSVHCVQAFGILADQFQLIYSDLLLEFNNPLKKNLNFPPKIMLHSYTGSGETLKRLVKLTKFSKRQINKFRFNLPKDQSDFKFQQPIIYISISNLVNHKKLDKLKEIVDTIGLDKILLESDCNHSNKVDSLMKDGINMLAKALDLLPQQIIDQCSINSSQFFNY